MTEARTSKEMFKHYLKEAENAAFSGWDFSFVYKTTRLHESPLKWNYYNVALPYLKQAERMLDMGTGGGETLSNFAPLPPVTYVTEQYHPNVAVAKKNLEPLGVKVFEVEEEKSPPYNTHLPFDNDYFDLVLNRHAAYYPPEVMRILKPSGHFITQQVGSLNNITLAQFFLGKTLPVSNWNLKSAVDEVKAAGFKVVQQQEDVQYFRYYDIGAIVYFLKAIPWAIENFSVAKYQNKLWELHVKICEDGFYDTPCHRFIIVAKKQK
jgi:SAM-dependent methyltransferase